MFNSWMFNQKPINGVFRVPATPKRLPVPQFIEVRDTEGNTVALLSPESDGLKNCWIDDEQNGSCTLEFELPLDNPKWQYLTDQYRIYAGDKEFVILNPDAVDKQRDGQKLKGKIKAHESWVLLGKKYQTICNDPLIGTPPWGAVIIVSGGTAHGGFDPGSAGSALSYLLQGTGWTVGTVDVTGTYDLETEKESVLYNINQVQEKWGGILIWDSVNKTVSLRDEATYKPYTGFQIRYAKNLKGITRTDDYDIVTRLYPFGENDLNIANVNGGLLYLDNHSYSDDILEGVWYNQDIADQTQLKAAGERQLGIMCRPRFNYKTEVLDLRSLLGYGHETFKRSDMVDLLDEDFGTDAQVRIIRYRYNVFQPWLCDMELGDPLEKIQATVAQTVLMAKFYKNVVAPNTSFQNLLKAIINTAATEINGASGDYTLVDGVSTWFDRDSETGELTGKLLRITPQGLIISHDGGQTWKLAISGEGIHADAGWVGKLNAGVVTIGADTTFEPGYDPVDNHLYFEYSVDGMNWHPIFNSASDLYMRQKVGDNGTWSEPARIAAVDGVDGVDGQDGTSIVWKGEFTSHPISPQNGWAYRNTADGKSYVYQDGTWYQMTIDGVDGQDGYTPVKGVDYFDGVDGQDGVSSYLWVRYSQNSNGDPMTTDPTGAVYIGVATTTTPTAPTSYTAYQWSLIKGQDGVPGEKGADGKTSYLHIKYSDDGVNFTGNGGEDVGAYIGTYVDFNPVDSMNFNDYTWNKVKGTPIVWKGELASPPSNPEENWVYRDTDNGYVYIYNGTVWELMVTDGADGIDGAPGVDGMSVYITYHNNPTDSQPATPTGDGTSGGWYTAPSAQANWMSQKVATNAYSGTWGAPILISGGRKFTSQPVPPYDVGDLWIGGSDGQNTLICTTARSSGSFVASDWERMTEPVANMGVDSDCLGLWHFDGSLNSHKGIPAIGDENFDTGCFGQAVEVFEGTTNLLTANQSNVETDLTGFTAYDTNATISRDIAEKWQGEASIKCVAVAANTGFWLSFAAVSGVTYTFSAYVKPTTIGNIYLTIDGACSTTVFHHTDIPTDRWTRIVGTVTATSSGTIYVYIRATTALTWFADGLQVEAKSHATHWLLGGATRLGVLKTPTTGLSPSQGTISLRAKNLSESANGSVLVDLPKSDNTQGIKAGIANDGKIFLSDSDKASKSYTETSQADFNSGTLTDAVATSTGDLELKKDVFSDNCSSVTGWTMGGEGTAASDGNSFYAANYGSGSSYHGPTLTKTLGASMGDITCIFDVTWLNNIAGASGSLLISLLDSYGNETAFIRMHDGWADESHTLLVARAGSSDIFNTGSGSTTYNNYSGTLKLVRKGSTWTFYAGDTLLGTLTGGTTTEVTQIKLTFLQYGTSPTVTTVKVNDINIITPYKPSGTREKIVDISGAIPAGGTSISWSKTTPTNTTVKVETALSTDGGTTYGAYQEATSGSSIPGIAAGTNLSNARLKIKETLSTTDPTVTPKLHSLTFNIWEKQASTVYGPNKSTLTGWESISLAWKPDRLSLVVNDSEACYIENPGLPTAFGSYLYIGSDRNGANAINTLVDELRIDKVYRDVAIRTGWHKTGVPFYTSEDMKQWPGYVKVETDGLKVYDSSDDLRVLVGSWVEDAIRKYGIRIIDGLIEASKIYGTSFQSGGKGATSYVRIGAGFEPLEIKENGKTALNIWSSNGGMMQFYSTLLDSMMGQISVFDDAAGTGLRIHARNNVGSNRELLLVGSDIAFDASGHTSVESDLWVTGTLYSGGKSNIEVTENYGIRTLVVRESPDHKYIVEGIGEITNGTCRIDIEPIFLECIEPNSVARWVFQLTPHARAELWISEIADTYFVVSSDIEQLDFSWTMSAYRKNYADIYLPEYVSKGVR